jgi:hypothetical protein
MDQHAQKLKATVSELEQELRALESIDDESRNVLQQAVREIRAALREDEPSAVQRRSFVERLNDAVHKFEGSHPTLVGILNRLVDGLAEMGI